MALIGNGGDGHLPGSNRSAAVELFAIGGSAGALEALRTIVANLPAEFPAALCVTLHCSPDSPGLVPELLAAAGHLPAVHARDGEPITPGHIFVAPPDHHLLVDAKQILRLGRGPKENRFRPAIDPLFRSVARAYDARAAGILLSGGMDDGVAGLVAIKQNGGGVIVQDPADTLVPSMALAALRVLTPDWRLPARAIARAMIELTQVARRALPEGATASTRPAENPTMTEHLDKEIAYAMGAEGTVEDLARLGEPSLLTCPDCHGALVHLRNSVPSRFRCHTGHAYTMRSLLEAQHDVVEQTLWSAIRALDEQAALLRHSADHTEGPHGDADRERTRLRKEAEDTQWRGQLVRDAVRSHQRRT